MKKLTEKNINKNMEKPTTTLLGSKGLNLIQEQAIYFIKKNYLL